MESFQITTDSSVFDRFCFLCVFAYFDESMSSIGGYEPCRSWNTLYTNMDLE